MATLRPWSAIGRIAVERDDGLRDIVRLCLEIIKSSGTRCSCTNAKQLASRGTGRLVNATRNPAGNGSGSLVAAVEFGAAARTSTKGGRPHGWPTKVASTQSNTRTAAR